MIIGFLWVFFLVPETNGVRLEDMGILFGVPGAHARDLRKVQHSDWENENNKPVVQMQENVGNV